VPDDFKSVIAAFKKLATKPAKGFVGKAEKADIETAVDTLNAVLAASGDRSSALRDFQVTTKRTVAMMTEAEREKARAFFEELLKTPPSPPSGNGVDASASAEQRKAENAKLAEWEDVGA